MVHLIPDGVSFTEQHLPCVWSSSLETPEAGFVLMRSWTDFFFFPQLGQHRLVAPMSGSWCFMCAPEHNTTIVSISSNTWAII